MKLHTAYATLLLSMSAVSEAANQDIRRARGMNGKSGKSSKGKSASCSASETENEAYNELSALIFDGTCKPLDVSTLANILGLAPPFDRTNAAEAAAIANAQCDLTGGRLVAPFANANADAELIYEASVVGGYAFCCPKCDLDEEMIRELCTEANSSGPGAFGVFGAAGLAISLVDLTQTQPLPGNPAFGQDFFLCPAYLTNTYVLPPSVIG